MDRDAALSTGSIASSDCITCHTKTNAKISFAATSFHSKIGTASITSCVDCYVKPTVDNVDSLHMSHTSTTVPNDYYACHKGDIVQGLTPTAWSKPYKFHAGTNANLSKSGSVVSSCQECHGPTIGSTIIAWDHINIPAAPGGVKYCMYCHLTGQHNVATAGLTKFQTKPINHHGTITATDTCEYCHTPGQNVHQNFAYPNPWNSPNTGNISGP